MSSKLLTSLLVSSHSECGETSSNSSSQRRNKSHRSSSLQRTNIIFASKKKNRSCRISSQEQPALSCSCLINQEFHPPHTPPLAKTILNHVRRHNRRPVLRRSQPLRVCADGRAHRPFPPRCQRLALAIFRARRSLHAGHRRGKANR